jgi:hypothetical protein
MISATLTMACTPVGVAGPESSAQQADALHDLAACSSSSSSVVSVRRITVAAPSGGDDTAAIQAAVDSAVAGGTGEVQRVVLRSGTYRIGSSDGVGPALRAADACASVELVGDATTGTTLLLTTRGPALGFSNLKSVALRNLTVDVATSVLPHIGGTVTSLSNAAGGTLTLAAAAPYLGAIRANMPLETGTDASFVATANGMTKRPLGREGVWLNFDGAPQPPLCQPGSSAGTVICRGIGSTALREGMDVVLILQKNGSDAININATGTVEVMNVRVSAAAGMGLMVNRSGEVGGVLVRDFSVLPSQGRWMSVTAGATHFANNRGPVRFQDCTFESHGDDGFNFHNDLLRVISISGSELRVVRAMTSTAPPDGTVRAGDELAFHAALDPFDDSPTRFATSVARLGSETAVTVAGALPPVAVGDYLSSWSANPSTALVRVTVRNNRGRGVLVSAPNVDITGSTFEATSGPGILVTSDSDHFAAGRTPQHVHIGADGTGQPTRIIESARTGASHAREGMLVIAGDLDEEKYSRFRSLEDVRIDEVIFAGLAAVPRVVAAGARAALDQVTITRATNFGGGLCPFQQIEVTATNAVKSVTCTIP